MVEPKIFIACAPFGAGVSCALFYFVRENHVYGWWIGARDAGFQSAYFKLEDYFTNKPPRFYATAGSDLYDGWRYEYSARRSALDKPAAVPGDALHELNRLQDAFAAEWLVFADKADATEREAYDRMRMVLTPVAVRSKRLGLFDKSQPTWVHRSHGCDMNVVEYLQKYWPLDARQSFAESMP